MRLALSIVIWAACSHSHGVADSGPSGHGPNVVFILTDDLDVEVYGRAPRLKQMLDDQGLSFREHFLNISLCCPSRTAILRGQYAHNTKIFSNAPPTGGFETFYANGSEAQTLPVWLSAAGYRTVLMGKYLNGYPNTAPGNYIPPGWTEWYSPVSGNPYSEYNYGLNENGSIVSYAATPSDYMVDVISNKAVDFIHRASGDHVPFFMYIAPFSPHAPATPAPRYANDFPGAMAPRTASFNQADVSQMPAWVQALPQLTTMQIANIDALYRKRLQSMEGIEDMVQSVIDALDQTGELDNTYIVFTSDNGFHQGQHRLMSGKNTEFDEDLFVPLIVRGPGVPKGATVDVMTLNIDFAPTFLDLAAAAIPDSIDGRSLLPMLGGSLPGSWRDAVFLEHAADVPDNTEARASVASTLEPPDVLAPLAAPPSQSPPPFDGVRTAKYTYVEYETGDKALYDHDADPAQVKNIAASAPASLLSQLAGLVHNMHGCQSAACRSAEQVAAP
jgi:N-acetylglucosamine-6-sulfatase